MIARVATRVQVMYAGRSAEIGDVDDVFDEPAHPYTRGPAVVVAGVGGPAGRLQPIAGFAAVMLHPPPGCAFHPRCPYAADDLRPK